MYGRIPGSPAREAQRFRRGAPPLSPTDHGNGVGLMDQDVAADSGVEAGLSGRYTGARCA
jgi:hypothetical protein